MEYLVTCLCATAPTGTVHAKIVKCNLSTASHEVVYELRSEFCDRNARSGDRGFRGISYDSKRNRYLVTTASSVLVFGADFQLRHRVEDPSFSHLHTIKNSDESAYIVSTGSDRIIEIDLGSLHIVRSWHIYENSTGDVSVALEREPPKAIGPWRYHFNSLQLTENGFYIGSARAYGLFEVQGTKINRIFGTPEGSHDFHYQDKQLTYLDTEAGSIVTIQPDTELQVKNIAQFTNDVYENVASSSAARAGLLRGLYCVPDTGYMVFGFSPLGVGVYDPAENSVKSLLHMQSDAHWVVSAVMPVG